MSEPTLYLDGRVAVHAGDCFAVVKSLADNSIDACVCDPPYALVSIGKRFAAEGARLPNGSDPNANPYNRVARGFMGKAWDNGSTAFAVDFWAEVFRVLKPGAHVVAFGGTRTYHRLAVAIEDAGFECRDAVMWHYGVGFPKSHSLDKAIDRAAGAERTKIRHAPRPETSGTMAGSSDSRPWIESSRERGYHEVDSDEPATDAARAWEGWGTALKPATEIIFVGRKPLSEGTVAANVLRWGTGAINVDACRVETGEDQRRPSSGGDNGLAGTATFKIRERRVEDQARASGRWPANLLHDNSSEVLAAFPDSESTRSEVTSKPGAISVNGAGLPAHTGVYGFDDAGSAARFFFSAKADADDRLGSKHPTVKPLDLMQWLCRLVCPPGGTILVPFSGTGTTGEAAYREGFNAVLCEREVEYLSDIKRRMALAAEGQMTRKHESAKARAVGKVPNHGPLFGGTEYAGGGRQIYGTFADQLGRSDQRGSNGEDR